MTIINKIENFIVTLLSLFLSVFLAPPIIVVAFNSFSFLSLVFVEGDLFVVMGRHLFFVSGFW